MRCTDKEITGTIEEKFKYTKGSLEDINQRTDNTMATLHRKQKIE